MQLPLVVEQAQPKEHLVRDARDRGLESQPPRVHDILEAPTVHVLHGERDGRLLAVAEGVLEAEQERNARLHGGQLPVLCRLQLLDVGLWALVELLVLKAAPQRLELVHELPSLRHVEDGDNFYGDNLLEFQVVALEDVGGCALPELAEHHEAVRQRQQRRKPAPMRRDRRAVLPEDDSPGPDRGPARRVEGQVQFPAARDHPTVFP
mmetsp:Transcript_41542/g.130083  ORF Transcript_41542/g.130083 Transcript_41542/m.130083 type:complete len:207 (-) Transcript_41542:1191-1811(-)